MRVEFVWKNRCSTTDFMSYVHPLHREPESADRLVFLNSTTQIALTECAT